MAGKISGIEIEKLSLNGEELPFAAFIDQNGFEGDTSRAKGIIILNAEAPHYINTELGGQILPGHLHDNILIAGLELNISVLPAGTRLKIGRKVLFEIVSKADHYRMMFPELSEAILEYLEEWGGVSCRVISGVGERICRQQEVEILHLEK